MNVNVTAIQLHTREQVEAIIDEAREIADASDGDVEVWAAHFAAAAALLGARHVIESRPVPISPLAEAAKWGIR